MLRWQFVRKIARENDGLRSVTPDGKAFLHIHVWVCARCTRLGRSMGFNLSCDGEDKTSYPRYHQYGPVVFVPSSPWGTFVGDAASAASAAAQFW